MAKRRHNPEPDANEQIELFLHWASQLQNTRLLQNMGEHSFSLNFDQAKGLQFKTTTPNEEDLRSFLMVIRRFISNDEPTYFFKLYKLCIARINSDELRKGLMEARNSWQAGLKSDGFGFNYNGHEYTPEEITDLWINGYYFHNDSDKLRLLKSLQPLESVLMRFKFITHLLDATRAILYVRHVMMYAIREGLMQ
jgi:hypothetical protein